jgi:hypothetical protein
LCGTNTLKIKVAFAGDTPGKLMRKPIRAMGTRNMNIREIRYLLVSAMWRIFVIYELPFTRNNLQVIIKM